MMDLRPRYPAPFLAPGFPFDTWQFGCVSLHSTAGVAAPNFDANGKLAKPAYAAAILNDGVLQNRNKRNGPGSLRATTPNKANYAKGPFSVQDPVNPTAFRNIWIRAIDYYN